MTLGWIGATTLIGSVARLTRTVALGSLLTDDHTDGDQEVIGFGTNAWTDGVGVMSGRKHLTVVLSSPPPKRTIRAASVSFRRET